jgi:4-hydroxy-tetrahydrodipicolinate synthase
LAQSSVGFGLSCALTTPFAADGALDLPRFAAHAGWCLDQGCASVTVFGTTGEGASLGLSARQQAIGALKAYGIDLHRQVVGGVAAAAHEDALDHMRLLLDAGVRAVLLAPPFYFKDVGDDGLFAWFSGLFDALGSQLRDIILYNIPSVTAVAISPALVTRLRAAYPNAITGVKDSSGSWDSARAFLAAHGDLAVLIGDERLLAQAMALGAEGAISGLANIMPERLAPLIVRAVPDPVVADIVDELLTHPVTPAVKAMVADRTGDEAWRRVRAPLKELDEAEAAQLRTRMKTIMAARAA